MFKVQGEDLLEVKKYPSTKGQIGRKACYSFNGAEYKEYLSLRGGEKDFVFVEGDAVGIRGFYQFMLWFMVNKRVEIGSCVYGIDKHDVDKNGNNRGLRKWKNVLCVDVLDEETKRYIGSVNDNSDKYVVDQDGDLCVYVGGNLLSDNQSFVKMFKALSRKQDISNYALEFGGILSCDTQTGYNSYYNYNGTANGGCQYGEFLTNECVREYKGNLYFMMPHSVITGNREDASSFVIARMGFGEREINKLKIINGGVWVNTYYSGFSVFDDTVYFISSLEDGKYSLTGLNIETKEETSRDITHQLKKSGWEVVFVSYPVKNRNGEFLFVVSYKNDDNQLQTYLVGENRNLKLGDDWFSYKESAYNEKYLYAGFGNSWKCVDLITWNVMDLDKKINGSIRYIDAQKDLFYIEGQEGQLLAINMDREKTDEISLPEVIIGCKVEYQRWHYDRTKPSLVFNGECLIAVIPQATDDAGRRYGVIIFDKKGEEIRRYEWETKEKELTYDSQLALCIPGAVCLSLEMVDVKTKEAAKWGGNSDDRRWMFDMLYLSESDVKREEKVFGIFLD